jgi:hypothetical protein
MVMLYKDNKNGKLCAVSYDSVTFADLKFFLNNAYNIELERIDPDLFLNSIPTQLINYINLVTKFPLRKKVTDHLNHCNAARFSYSVDDIPTVDLQKSSGSFFYPNVSLYPGAIIGQDIIIHSNSLIAHGSNISSGCFISGGVIVCGGATIGNNCWVGASVTVVDQINIANDTTISVGGVVHKNIDQPGTIFINTKLKKNENID